MKLIKFNVAKQLRHVEWIIYTALFTLNCGRVILPFWCPKNKIGQGEVDGVCSQGETIMAVSELSCRKTLLALSGPFLSFPQIGFESSSLALWGQGVQTQGNWECGMLGSK